MTLEYADKPEVCDRCHKPIPIHHVSGGTGYETDRLTHQIYCYDCCADLDKEYMRTHGIITLYFIENSEKSFVSNWPGTLIIPIRRKRVSRNNWNARRVDFWFDFEGFIWHGVHVGESHTIANCKRTKQTW